jgi:Variant SH3 domain
VHEHNGEWYDGELNGVRGFFPSSYVEPYEAAETSEPVTIDPFPLVDEPTESPVSPDPPAPGTPAHDPLSPDTPDPHAPLAPNPIPEPQISNSESSVEHELNQSSSSLGSNGILL